MVTSLQLDIAVEENDKIFKAHRVCLYKLEGIEQEMAIIRTIYADDYE